jgi:hypothetical protein
MDQQPRYQRRWRLGRRGPGVPSLRQLALEALPDREWLWLERNHPVLHEMTPELHRDRQFQAGMWEGVSGEAAAEARNRSLLPAEGEAYGMFMARAGRTMAILRRQNEAQYFEMLPIYQFHERAQPPVFGFVERDPLFWRDGQWVGQ